VQAVKQAISYSDTNAYMCWLHNNYHGNLLPLCDVVAEKILVWAMRLHTITVCPSWY